MKKSLYATLLLIAISHSAYSAEQAATPTQTIKKTTGTNWVGYLLLENGSILYARRYNDYYAIAYDNGEPCWNPGERFDELESLFKQKPADKPKNNETKSK